MQNKENTNRRESNTFEESMLVDALTEAWQIINVLAMHTVDEGEPYPKALFWLEQNKQFKPQNKEVING